MYVADTHGLIWHLTGDERLGSEAREVFERADAGEVEVVIPTIVLAEALYVSRKYKASFDQLLEKVNKGKNYGTYPLNMRIIVEMKKLQAPYSIHDAVIVATAKLLDATTLTNDETIRDSKDVETVWK